MHGRHGADGLGLGGRADMTLSKRRDARQRQQEALELMMNDLKAQGNYRRSAKNDCIADNMTAGEVGEFDSAEGGDLPEFTDDMMKGFIVRIRSDVIATRLNTADMVDRLVDVERKVDRLGVTVYWVSAVLFAIAFMQFRWS
jgi:hypothetical protein